MATEIDIGTREGWIERTAKLFEAGDYPDKGIAVTEEDLAALAAGFAGEVPVLIEHAASPLELGFLTAVARQGRELHGTVAFSPEADALVRRSGARGLSLGLSPDLREIREVSLVRRPRVAGAGLFSEGGCVAMVGEISEPLSPLGERGSRGMRSGAPQVDGGGGMFDPPSMIFKAWSQHERLDGLETIAAVGEPSPELGRLVREGRMVPSQVPFAEAILACEGVVEFSGDRLPLRELLIAMLERQPPLALFGQTAPIRANPERPTTMLPEEAEFYRRHFPGVSLTDIAEAKK